jgi:hypothetical protein
MALEVQVNRPGKISSVQVTGPGVINTSVKKVQMPLVKLEELVNVDENVNGLQNGYTLVYNASTQTWITQEIESIVGLDNIDGGTY